VTDRAPANLVTNPRPAAKVDAAHVGNRSLEGMHGTVALPHHEAGFGSNFGRSSAGYSHQRRILDPGNWGTDLQAGAQFKYGLLWIVRSRLDGHLHASVSARLAW